MILRNAYNDPKAANWLSERVHAPVVTLPFSVGGTPGAKDLYGLFDDSIRQLLAVPKMSNFAVDLSILWPALVAGLLVVLSHVPLGQQVLKRGIVFIDLAIAQVAALGVIAAHPFGHELAGWATQLAAVDRGAGRRAAAHLDRAQAARGAGGADRRSCSCWRRQRRSCCWPTTRTAANT